jgi:hypothetical protein
MRDAPGRAYDGGIVASFGDNVNILPPNLSGGAPIREEAPRTRHFITTIFLIAV